MQFFPLPPIPGSCAGWAQGWGAGGVAQGVTLALGLCPVPCLSLAGPLCCCHTKSSAFADAGGQSCISRRQNLLCFTSFYEADHPSCLMHWKQKRTWSLLPLLSLYLLLGEPSCTQVINFMWSKVFLLHWETLFIQDVHGLFKVKLTSIEKIISDLCA